MKMLLIAAFLFVVPASAHNVVECRDIPHYVDDYKRDGTINYVQFDEAADAKALTATLVSMDMTPPGKPAYYLFLSMRALSDTPKNMAASVIAIFDKDECYIASLGLPSQTTQDILQTTFPGREFKIIVAGPDA